MRTLSRAGKADRVPAVEEHSANASAGEKYGGWRHHHQRAEVAEEPYGDYYGNAVAKVGDGREMCSRISWRIWARMARARRDGKVWWLFQCRQMQHIVFLDIRDHNRLLRNHFGAIGNWQLFLGS